jgi:hypothetical protein
MGEGESAITESPFHIMKAVERIKPKLRSWAAACRGFWSAESMLGVEGFGRELREFVDAGGSSGVARRRDALGWQMYWIVRRQIGIVARGIDKGVAAC